MTGIRQNPKAVICLVTLVLAAVGILIVGSVYGASDAGTTSGVYWEVSVYNLSYSSATQRTSSSHRYLVENNYINDDGEYAAIKPKFRFAHFVVKPDNSYTYNEDGSIKHDSDEGFGATVPATGAGDHSDTLGTSVANLDPGDYKIYAYTELDIYDAADTGGTPIVSGPGVNVEYDFTKVGD